MFSRLLLVSSFNDVLAGLLLRSACLEALSVEALAGTGMSTALAAFTTTHRVIVGIHDDAAVVWTTSEPAAAASLTGALESVVAVAYAADRGLAGAEDLARLARGELDDAITALAGGQLGEVACGTNQQSALTGTELDVVDYRTDGNVLQGKSVAYFGSGLGA